MTAPLAVSAAVSGLLVPAAAWWATAADRRRCAGWEQRRLATVETARELSRRQQGLRQEHETLERTMGRLAGLYDLTKRLLLTLDRREAARALADVLTGAFPQAAFRLGLVPPEDGQPPAVLQLQRDGVVDAAVTPDDQWMLARFLRQPVIWSAHPMVGMAATADAQIPEGLRTATAFPLLMDGALHGFLAADRLAPDDVERCGILVSQFALALRRIRLYERVQELAIRDGLTGVFVRRHFLARFQEEVARAARHGSPLAFLMVDLDHFKQVNDTHGHLVGDTVLRELAALLRTQVRDVDLVGRYGGEEFGVALLDTGPGPAQVVADRIRQAVANAAFRAYDERLTITVSIGVAGFPQDAADAAELVERADAAMYQAKQAGRNHVSAAAGLPRR